MISFVVRNSNALAVAEEPSTIEVPGSSENVCHELDFLYFCKFNGYVDLVMLLID